MMACSKKADVSPDDNGGAPPDTENPVSDVEVTTSVQGRVSHWRALDGFTVKIGGKTATTTARGTFLFENVTVKKEAAVVNVTKPGFMPKTYTFMVTNEEQVQTVELALTEAKNMGTFDAASGGTVSITNTVSFTFLPQQMLKADNTPYNGQVTVYTNGDGHWGELSLGSVPGNTRAIDKDNKQVVIDYGGLLYLELAGAGGEQLHLDTTGGKAVSFAATQGYLHEIAGPLWYLDETSGFWREAGTAVKSGTQWTGKISRLGYWMQGNPHASIELRAMLRDTTTGLPLANLPVRVYTGYAASLNYTDAAGNLACKVPAGSEVELELFDAYSGINPLQPVNVGYLSASKDLGVVHIDARRGYVSYIGGTVTDCNTLPVESGVIHAMIDSLHYTYPFTNGAYKIPIYTVFHSGASSSARVWAVDNKGAANVTPRTRTLSYYDQYALYQDLNTCGLIGGQYFSYNFLGSEVVFNNPKDSVALDQGYQSNNWYTGGFYRNYTGSEVDIELGPSIALGTRSGACSYWDFGTRDSWDGTVQYTITKTGGPGDWLEGTYTGTMTKWNTTTTAPISGSFRRKIPNVD
jgi:hypothetical protein